MNRHEQFLFAYIVIGILRLIASALAGGVGFRTQESLNIWTAESARLKEIEHTFLNQPDTGITVDE